PNKAGHHASGRRAAGSHSKPNPAAPSQTSKKVSRSRRRAQKARPKAAAIANPPAAIALERTRTIVPSPSAPATGSHSVQLSNAAPASRSGRLTEDGEEVAFSVPRPRFPVHSLAARNRPETS